jgi:hypothetical protein
MDKSISTPSTSPLESIPKELLKLLTAFLSKKSHKALTLALMNKDLLAFYKERVDSILLWVPPPKRPHLKEPEAMYLNGIKSSLKYCRTGWGCTKITTIESASDTSKYASVDAICLNEPFELPKWISKYTERIRHISLSFYNYATNDLSFLEKFTNLETLCFLGVRFNDNMVAMIVSIIVSIISKPQPLFSLILHDCGMRQYLPTIAEACRVENFVLSKCSSFGQITPPSQCRRLKLDCIYESDSINLSNCDASRL